MVVPVLVHVEARLQVEDRFPVLDRDDAARGERLAVADAVDLVQDRRVRVAGAQEVPVERVDVARRPDLGTVVDGASGSDECLPRDLSTEHALTLLVG